MEATKFVRVTILVGTFLFFISLLLDKQVVSLIPYVRSAALDAIAMGIALINRIAILVIVVILLFRKRTHLRNWCLTYLAASAAAWILKEMIQRPRPFETAAITPLIEVTGYAFPSGHATVLFAALPIIVGAYPSYRWLILVIFLIIIVTRVYLGIHYASDVIGGAVIGILVAKAVLALINRVLPDKA